MERFISYINTELPDVHGESVLFKFKKKTLDEMVARAAEVRSRGLTNDKVIDELVISEHPDLKKEYKDFSGKEYSAINTKRKIIMNVLGSVIYIIALVTVFLAVSFMTHRWDMTWAIITSGILLWVDYLLMLGVIKLTSMKKIFHIFARILLAGAVIIFAVAVFLCVVAMTDIRSSWLIVIAGLALMFICDGIFAIAAKHRLAILSWLLYIPVIFTFLFIITGASHILSWSIGWIMIPLSLIIDLVIIFAAIAKNKAHKVEVEDTWKEN